MFPKAAKRLFLFKNWRFFLCFSFCFYMFWRDDYENNGRRLLPGKEKTSEESMSDLFENSATAAKEEYSARDIEVLEGLDPVRHRPGMYIGGTDEQALHHLVAEILDNSMDEAVAGYANRIDIAVNADLSVTITDNGRGIPVDDHPKYPGTRNFTVRNIRAESRLHR